MDSNNDMVKVQISSYNASTSLKAQILKASDIRDSICPQKYIKKKK